MEVTGIFADAASAEFRSSAVEEDSPKWSLALWEKMKWV